MKTSTLFWFTLSLALFLNVSVFAQSADISEDREDLSISTALTWPCSGALVLASNRRVWPLLGVKKIGMKKRMELRIQPLFFFISPNVGIKKIWRSNGGFRLASLHQLNYPSIYLNLISRAGTGGVLPEDSEIPGIIVSRNEFIVSKGWINSMWTARLGFAAALTFGEANFPEIDFPFIYNRTSVYHSKFTPYIGVAHHRNLFKKFHLEAEFTAFKITNATGGFVFEDRAVLFWQKSAKFGLKLGLASAFGKYPYGNDFRLIPIFDVLFGFNRKTKD